VPIGYASRTLGELTALLYPLAEFKRGEEGGEGREGKVR